MTVKEFIEKYGTKCVWQVDTFIEKELVSKDSIQELKKVVSSLRANFAEDQLIRLYRLIENL